MKKASGMRHPVAVENSYGKMDIYKGQTCRLILYLFCFHIHSKSSTVLPYAFIAKEKILKAITSHCRIIILIFKSIPAIETMD